MKIFVRKGFIDWLVLVFAMSVASITVMLLIDFLGAPALNYLLYDTRFEFPTLWKIVDQVLFGFQLGVFSGTIMWCANKYFK